MRLPGAYMTARQVGLALGVARQRIEEIEGIALRVIAARFNCSVDEVIAHLYAWQLEEHGELITRPDANPPRDEEWIAEHGGRHYARVAFR